MPKLTAVKVGPRWFTVVHKSLQKEGHAGQIDYESCEIAIDDSIPPGYQAETLIHELLHACIRDSGEDFEAQDEEFVVCMLAPRISALLADNPDLHAYLQHLFDLDFQRVSG